MSATIAACAESVSPVETNSSQTFDAAPNHAHIHIDGFFAAVEQSLRPRLRGKPVLVGGDTVISASYEAKLLGISTGMAIEQTRSISPNATILSPRYDRYAECAELLRSVLENFACTVDPDSHHGFYLNFFGSPLLQHDFPGTLRRLQLEILKLAGLPVSIGAGKSKIIAAIASRLERPCGLRIITRGTESAFLATLPIEALDGVSRIKSANLRKRGITTLAELRRVPLASLQCAYGDSTGR